MKLLVTLLLLTAGAALAQPGRAYFPWWEGRFSRDMDLSAEQREEIRSIQKNYRDRMIDERAVVEKAEARLEDLFGEEEISSAAAKAAIDSLVEARGAMTRSLTELSLEMRQVLTTAQWKELERKRTEMRERMMREFRGGQRRPSERRGKGPGDAKPPKGPPPPPPQDELP